MAAAAAAASSAVMCSLVTSNQSFVLAVTHSSPNSLPVRAAASTHKSSALSSDHIPSLQKHSPLLLQPHNSKFQPLITKATGQNQNTKPNSIVCADCDGNGAVQCSQCKGTGVNSVDHFNGQFKAGALCWLCSGKQEILCGSCNGAGFLGGFMSTFDE